jgi:hypothetical protein
LNSKNISTLEQNVKVKIVFVDQGGKIQKGIRKFLSPIATDLNLTRLGLFHTALIIGPWYLEWNDSSLCIPRKCTSRMAFLTADVGEIESKENIEKISEKLSKIIVSWNENVLYSNKESKNHGNCQTFVESVLHQLGMSFKPSGSLHHFIERIKQTGSSKLVFPAHKSFKEKFDLEQDDYIFNTHIELDQFVHKLNSIDLEFEFHHKDEYKLLKSFDRAFWLNYTYSMSHLTKDESVLEILESSNLKPSGEVDEKIRHLKEHIKIQKQLIDETKPFPKDEDSFNCPFDDPNKTNSIKY